MEEEKPRTVRAKKAKCEYNVRESQKGQNCNLIKWRRENPELAAASLKKAHANNGRKKDQPDGYNAKDAAKLREQVKREAKIIVKHIAEEMGIDEKYATEALETVVELMRMPGDRPSKLSAAKVVLEYTKQKPVTKSDVTVSKAEDFLAAILAKEAAKE